VTETQAYFGGAAAAQQKSDEKKLKTQKIQSYIPILGNLQKTNRVYHAYK
jgi:hypothetical protein